MSTISERIARTKEAAANTPPFKTDPAENGGPLLAAAAEETRAAPVVATPRRPVRSRRRRITVDLDEREYAALKALRSPDVGIAGVVRGAVALLSRDEKLAQLARELGAD